MKSLRRDITTQISGSENRYGAKSLRFVLALAASLIVGLLTPLPTLAIGVDQKVSSICKHSKDAAFREKYCGAAKDFKKGYLTNVSTAAVWAGVTATCAAACGKAFGGMICKGASMAGGTSEGVLTKKFTDSLMGEGKKIGVSLLTKEKDTAKEVVTEGVEAAKSKGLNGDACMVAGTSAMKSYEKFANSKQNSKQLGELKKQSDDLTPAVAAGGLGFKATGSDVTPSSSGAITASAATATGGSVCEESSLKTALGTIRCAAQDPTLPAFVQTEEFLKDLQKATGKTADQFFGSFENPSKALFESASINELPAAQQTALAETAGAMERYSDLKANAMVASTGNESSLPTSNRAAPSFDTPADFDMNAALAAALGGLGGEAAPEKVDTGVTSLSVSERKPAAVVSPEDRKVSIFDRVKWRYGAISARGLNAMQGVK